MSLRSRFSPLSREAVFSIVAATQAEGSRQFDAFVRGQIAEAEATNAAALGHPVPYESRVNGRASTDFSGLLPGAEVVTDFDLGGLQVQVLTYIAEQLIAHAPVKTGRYRSSIVMLVNGEEVDDIEVAAKAADDIVFMDTQPYARKVERRTAGGVFEAVAALAGGLYGGIASIKFTSRTISADVSPEFARLTRAHVARNAGRRRARQQYLRQPAIAVRFF